MQTRRLYLVQHGVAKSKEEDPERALADEGRQGVETMGRFLASRGIRPDRIEHSGKLRARQTAEILAGHVEPPESTREVADIAPMDDVGSTAERLDGLSEDVMIVGHLPHLARLAARLVVGDGGDLLVVRFQMGGVVCLERDESEQWAVKWALVTELVE